MRCTAVVLVLSWLAPAAALAQPAEDARAAARATFEAGNVAYAAGRYTEAATAYEEAFRLDPLPAILFSAAQAYRRRFYDDPDPRWLVRARELYREYLARDPQGTRREHSITHLSTIDALLARLDAPEPASGDAAVRATQLMVSSRTPGARGRIDDAPAAPVPVLADVTPGPHHVTVQAPGFLEARETHVAVEGRLVVAPVELRARPGTLQVRAPDGATVLVDGRTLGLAPLATVELPAGRHRVVVIDSGRRPLSHVVELARAESRSLSVRLAPTGQRRAAWATLGTAGATLVASAVTGALALAAQERAQERAAPLASGTNLPPPDLASYNDDLSARNDLRTASITLLVGSVALAVTGALLYWLDHPRPDSP